jgi:crotonobetainyl-CoA:carnitine CoA-transferase CaiB-like acyl-CoA transferase
VLERLVLEKADVVVQNLAPGAAARLGLGYDVLAAKKPAIIVCDISGYGADGPYRDKKAYDLLIQSEAGFVSVTGTPDEPCKAGPVDRRHRAGMYAYTNILARCCSARRPGAASTSTSRCWSRWPNGPAIRCTTLRRCAAAATHRRGPRHHLSLRPVPDRRDDGSVMLGLQNEREWVNFCEKVLQRPELARDPRFAGNAKRVAERAALRELIVETFSALTTPQVVERLEAAQIANARVNTMHEVWDHPQLKARDRWREVGSPAGPLPAMLPPGTWDEEPRMDPVPALGEHTDAILRELGIDAEGVRRLRAAEAI